MNVRYVAPGIEAMLPALREAFEQEGAFWTDGLYAFYPQLDRERMRSLSAQARGRSTRRFPMPSRATVGRCLRM